MSSRSLPKLAPIVKSSRCSRPPYGRGLHWSTFRLNVNAFCGIGGACGGRLLRGCLRGCLGSVGGYHGVFGVYFVSEMAQVELKSGRLLAPAVRVRVLVERFPVRAVSVEVQPRRVHLRPRGKVTMLATSEHDI